MLHSDPHFIDEETEVSMVGQLAYGDITWDRRGSIPARYAVEHPSSAWMKTFYICTI